MKGLKKAITGMVLALCVSMIMPSAIPAFVPNENISEVFATADISTKKRTIAVGTKYRLKVNGTSKKVKWSTSNKNVATVSSKGLVKGISKGKATIRAKVGSKTLKCVITVKENKFKQKPVRIEKLANGYLHFYPLQVYYKDGKLYYKCRLYNRRSRYVKELTRLTLTVEANVDGYKHIIANKTFTDTHELNLNVGTYTNSATDLTFVFSGSSIYDKNFDLSNIKNIYYTASYKVTQ